MARILLIEPNTILAQTYRTALEHDGHQVQLAPSAQAAIIVADEQRPELVIMELQLARHNGVEFLYEFRSYAEWQDAPVIINSLVPPTEFIGNETLWGDIGVAAYLYKPQATLDRLLRTVNVCLAQVPNAHP